MEESNTLTHSVKGRFPITHKEQKVKRSFGNLDKIKPDLVIVDGLNDHVLRQFKQNYPGVTKNPPHYKLNYAGRTILFYELDF